MSSASRSLMRTRVRVPLLIGLLLTASCDAAETRQTAEESPTAGSPRNEEPSWESPPQLTEDGRMEVDVFNAFLEESTPAWATSPMRTSVEYVRLGDPGALRTTVEMEAFPPEGAEDVVVTIIEDGLADDSVRALRYTLHLSRQSDGTWRLTEARRDQRCQEGRGHTRFTPEACV